jgi:hypothetical protein
VKRRLAFLYTKKWSKKQNAKIKHYQVKEMLYKWTVFRLWSQVVDITQIEAFQPVWIALDNVGCPVLFTSLPIIFSAKFLTIDEVGGSPQTVSLLICSIKASSCVSVRPLR